MSVRVPYRSYPNSPTSYPYAPVLKVQIARAEQNAPRTKRFETFIDSGASRCLFHSSIGAGIGIDVKAGPQEDQIGISGKKTPVYLHDIYLYTPAGTVTIRAGFSDDLPCAGVLGMDGFFQNFKVTLDPINNQCEIERINRA